MTKATKPVEISYKYADKNGKAITTAKINDKVICTITLTNKVNVAVKNVQWEYLASNYLDNKIISFKYPRGTVKNGMLNVGTLKPKETLNYINVFKYLSDGTDKARVAVLVGGKIEDTAT